MNDEIKESFYSTYIMLCKIGLEIEDNDELKDFYKNEIEFFKDFRKGELI